MQLIDGQKRFQLAQALHTGDGVPQDLVAAESLYNEVLTHNLGNPQVLYCMGTLLLDTGRPGLALQLLSHVVNVLEEFGEAWNALGLTFKTLNQFDNADVAFEKAMEILPDTISDIPANRAAIRINNGTPEEALRFSNMALEIDPKNINCHFNKALALLELQRWEEAWPWHEERLNPNYRRADMLSIETRNYAESGLTPVWTPDIETSTDPLTIVVHGEQGIGDEIMFMSCFNDFRKLLPAHTTFVVEPHPRLEKIFNRAWPDVLVNGTHQLDGAEWIGKPNHNFDVGDGPSLTARFSRPDYKIAMGTLPAYTRKSEADFNNDAYLKLDPEKVKEMRALMPETGKLRVGIAWQGGIAATHVHIRSLHLAAMKMILEQDVDLVALQYTPEVPIELEQLKDETGIEMFYDKTLVNTEADIDDTAHLTASCDLIITVSQTLFHIAGAVGTPCWVLVPNKPDWRLGMEREHLAWYGNHLKCIRQPVDDPDWGTTIERVAIELSALIEKKVAA
jgi:Tfp pilus assembly protein PilF